MGVCSVRKSEKINWSEVGAVGTCEAYKVFAFNYNHLYSYENVRISDFCSVFSFSLSFY